MTADPARGTPSRPSSHFFGPHTRLMARLRAQINPKLRQPRFRSLGILHSVKWNTGGLL
jgi:hypothetical protein